jgi:hypothetical protein
MAEKQLQEDGEFFNVLTHLVIMVLSAIAALGDGIRGEKKAMIAHILGCRGKEPCPYTSQAAKDESVKQKTTSKEANVNKANPLKRKERDSDDVPDDVPNPPLKKPLRQQKLKPFKGMALPFSDKERDAIQAQALRTVVACNLPFYIWEQPEMLDLLGMFRSAAPGIMPSAKVTSGRLLNDAAKVVEDQIKEVFRGQEMGLS